MCKLSKILAAIGAINWGLIGVTSFGEGATPFNLVNKIIGSVPVAESIVYVVVGLAGVLVLYGAIAGCKK